MDILVDGPWLARSAECEPILRALPQWFGIEESNQHYLQAIDELPTVFAWAAGQVAGFLTLKQHFPHTAEVYVTGIRPDLHRQGIGRAMLLEAEQYLCQQGVEYLQVKTLGSTSDDAYYARTRAFYQALGFRPLEEIPQIWGAENPCLILVKRLDT